jgi:hypothetical protein
MEGVEAHILNWNETLMYVWERKGRKKERKGGTHNLTIN